MARCLEVNVVDESVFSIMGNIKDWDDVRRSAVNVEHVRDIDGPRDWGAMYLVQPASGPKRHYLVTDE